MKLCKMTTISNIYDNNIESNTTGDFSGSNTVVCPYRLEQLNDTEEYIVDANSHNNWGVCVYQKGQRKIEIGQDSIIMALYRASWPGFSTRIYLDISV